MPDLSSEAALENATLALFESLGWQLLNAYGEWDSGTSTLGRAAKSEVVLVSRLREALAALNPDESEDALTAAIAELTRDRSTLTPTAANRAVHQLLREGVKIPTQDEAGQATTVTLHAVDWETPANNDFLLVSQFWMAGETYTRRADLIGFLNGLPILFVELKRSHRRLKDAFDENLTTYRSDIPQLFWYAGVLLLSNGTQSVVGTLSSEWQQFKSWKRLNNEGEKGVISLETAVRGTCDPARLLDLLENFSLFTETQIGLARLLAQNHQYLGVNRAVQAVRELGQNQGRLGVFWHTQGSGKSYSMVFLVQKILRLLPGNWTFLIVTDRDELDTQIYQTFAGTGLVTEPEDDVRAESGEHLQTLLKQDHRFIFTLIQKFRVKRGAVYPILSERSDIIVIADEAHRSQYDIFATNMRAALPKAAFIGFTGTPLLRGDQQTRRVFGEYVSIYNFRRSVEDGATVPLYYENRIPELEFTNTALNGELNDLLDEAALDDEKEALVQQRFAEEYNMLTANDRLEKIAADLVQHFTERGRTGKAMVVCLDKATCVKMYDKVKRYWRLGITTLRADLETCEPNMRPVLEAEIAYMEQTDLAVVVSSSQNEEKSFADLGLDIRPHRRRMNSEDLESKFKNPDDPFRLVFLCAKWMTGFDVPCCSTIYLDKPMRNHTLMQTIARANRTFRDKVNGLIVDYNGIFRDLQRALAIYGSANDGGWKEGDLPVSEKQAQADLLRQAIAEARAFCVERNVDLDAILSQTEVFERVGMEDVAARVLVNAPLEDDLDDTVEKLIVNDELKEKFLTLVAQTVALQKAIRPHPVANEFYALCQLLGILAEKIRLLTEDKEVDMALVRKGGEAIGKSFAARTYVIRDRPDRLLDLSQLDFEALQARFNTGRQRTEAERLRAIVARTLRLMVRRNRARLDFQQRFQQMVADYNAGSANTAEFYQQLLAMVQALNTEEKRGLAEELNEEELAIFDLLTRPQLALTDAELKQVKTVARELIQALKGGLLVLEWRQRNQTRSKIRVAIQDTLDRLPDRYSTDLYQQKCAVVFQHVYDSYFGEAQSVYGPGE